jgi:hypothetical protein
MDRKPWLEVEKNRQPTPRYTSRMPRPPLLGLLLTAVVLSGGAAVATQEALPVPVFLTVLPTPPLPPLKPEEHEAAINTTRVQMYDLAAQLRKQHGDKTNKWPAEVWKEFYKAEDANMMAIARRDYQAPETRLALEDSVEDFVRGIGTNNKVLTTVNSAADAVLVVQITGRRRVSVTGLADNRYFVRFRIAPGVKLTKERFLEAAYGQKWNTQWATLFAHETDATPYVDLEGGSPSSFKNAASSVRATVLNFIRDKFDPARKK